MSIIVSFFLGILSSLIAIFIVYFFKIQFINLTEFIFSNVYPKIAGQWRLEFVDYDIEKPGHRVIMALSQFGSKVSGEMNTFDGDKLLFKDLIKGKVTPSRVFMFTFETKTLEHHRFGSGLFKFEADSLTLYGYLSFICSICQKTDSEKSTMKKIV